MDLLRKPLFLKRKTNDDDDDDDDDENFIDRGYFGTVYLSDDKLTVIKDFNNANNSKSENIQNANTEFQNIQNFLNSLNSSELEIFEKYTLIDKVYFKKLSKIFQKTKNSTMIQYKNCWGNTLTSFLVKIKNLKVDETSKKEILTDLFIKVAFACLSLLILFHEKGLHHCDLKPENIMLCDIDGGTKVKIIDFGIMSKKCETPTPTPFYKINELTMYNRNLLERYKDLRYITIIDENYYEQVGIILNDKIKSVVQKVIMDAKQSYNDKDLIDYKKDEFFTLGIILAKIYPYYDENNTIDISINNLIENLITYNTLASQALVDLEGLMKKIQTGGSQKKKTTVVTQMKKTAERVEIGKRNSVVYKNQHNKKYVRKSGKFILLSSLKK
jgi:serine/threonine protein kinase